MHTCPFLAPAGLAEMTLPSPLSLTAFSSLVAVLLTRWNPSTRQSEGVSFKMAGLR